MNTATPNTAPNANTPAAAFVSIVLVEVGVLARSWHQRANETSARPDSVSVPKDEADGEADADAGYDGDHVHAAFRSREGQVGLMHARTSAAALHPHAVQWLTSRTGISAVAGVTAKKSTRLPFISQAAVGIGSTIAQRSKGRESSIYPRSTEQAAAAIEIACNSLADAHSAAAIDRQQSAINAIRIYAASFCSMGAGRYAVMNATIRFAVSRLGDRPRRRLSSNCGSPVASRPKRVGRMECLTRKPSIEATSCSVVGTSIAATIISER